ncbi:MAG: peptidylprolyl isomerase, partial [Phycisphaerales bacterium]|nr:peptidylprolyl isomerase [Phycisphaerales bacterium]
MPRHAFRPASPRPIVFEPLEERVLLSADCPVIELIETDNRGLVTLTSSLQLRAGTVNSQTIRVFAAGSDGLIGTDDDVQVSADISYDNASRQIRIDGGVDADERYRIIVDGDSIVSTEGVALDAEFNGFGQDTGDGVAGGILDIYSRGAATSVARLVTAYGTIDIELFEDDTPQTVANFLRYANDGLYDQSFFHRLVEGFVIQGGGFFAQDDLAEIPKFGTVQNEPGISNTRGTVAMAKMAGNPNSATSEWFFNIGNNSANLDNQNGGFTVFGRITDNAGLAVLDDLADLMTVNAASQGSPFGELPVVDPQAFEDAGDQAEPDNLIVFQRISLLVEFDNEPFQQLDLEGAMTVTNPEGGATVTFVDVAGSGMLNGGDFFEVKFGRNDSIKSITLSKDMPDVPVGIVISETDEVGSIKDMRKGQPLDLAYLVSSAPVNNISLKSGISGMDLNNFVAPGIIFSDDIDNDNQRDDPIALYVAGGFVQSITISGDVTGDVVVMDGAGKVSIKGDMTDGDFTFGSDDRGRSVSIDAQRVNRSSLRSEQAIGTISVSDWRDTGARRNQVEAPSIRNIKTSGGSGVDGNFDVDLDISGAGGDQPDLGGVSIKGDIFSGDWSIGGDAGSIKVKGDALNWNLDVGGDLKSVDFGEGTNVNITVENELTSGLGVRSWVGGNLEVDKLRSVKVSDDANLIITVNNAAQDDFLTADFNFGGDFSGSVFVFGGARNLVVKGTVDDAEFRFADEVRNARFGRITDSDIEMLNGARKLTFTDWNGGELRGDQYRKIQATGSDRGNVPGDIRATINLGQFLLLRTSRGGDLETDASIQAAGTIDIAGDIVDSEIFITGGNQ